MDKNELIIKIEKLEKRVEDLEHELGIITKINQSERVKEYIASAEKARKIASLLDISSKNDDVDDLKHDKPDLAEILLDKPEMHGLDEAKEYVDNIENSLAEEIKDNNKVSNAYDWDSLFEYEEAERNITITNYIGFDDMDTVVIPDNINGFPVTSIGEKAFENCKGIKEIILPKYLKKIESNAFKGSGMATILLPENLIHIENRAFYDSKLESIHIPSKVVQISDDTFSCCFALKQITFSTGITSIESGAFTYCTKLKKIDIPNSVNIIGRKAFDGIGDFRTVTLNRGYDIFVRIPDSVEKIYGLEAGESKYDNIFGYDRPEHIIIYCNAGSTAMKFARKYGIPVKRYEEFDLLEE